MNGPHAAAAPAHRAGRAPAGRLCCGSGITCDDGLADIVAGGYDAGIRLGHAVERDADCPIN
jgi:hypothetical protein